ncbi:MAG: S-layer homology domain-containing protein [Clostridia bacterium]|nr:S-layer homology domain-containing protein [Clostridia bacterium]
MQKIYRFLLLFFAVSLLFSTVIFTISASAFSDVSESDWFAGSVAGIVETGLMIGTDADTFSPGKEITGAEGVTLLARVNARLSGEEEVLSAAVGAAAEGSPWYQGYLDYCAAKGLLTGAHALTEDKFSVPLTRAELLLLLSSLPDSVWTEINTVDGGAIPDVPADAVYYDAVYAAYRAGITIGTDNMGTFLPDRTITRAEVAALILRIVKSEMRLSVTLTAQTDNVEPAFVTLFAADGAQITVPASETADYLACGWRKTPYSGAFSAETLLNAAPLTPISTGYTPLDDMVDAIFSDILTDGMTTYEKVLACYDYLVENCAYGSSPVAGNYRPIYKKNPYASPAPTASPVSVAAFAGDRGYEYFYIALADHALEGYTAMYAAEMLDGMTGWCDHYSSAFAVLMHRLGLPCFPVYVNSRLGDDYKPHMTAVMTIGGVDCVFDPQIEAVLVSNTGKNQHKRFAIPVSEMTKEYRDWDNLEDCRALFGEFDYDPVKMSKLLDD